MQDLQDGESTTVKGSGSATYTLKNVGGMYSCSCPAWMHQSVAIETRTCKHLRAFRGDAAEQMRLGSAPLAGKPARAAKSGDAAPTEPPILLANKWEVEIDLTSFWLSEKLDGVRAYWDGTQFLSRLGNRFHAPDWFTVGLPDHPLDGELWGGRKKFQRTVGIVKRQDQTPLWKELAFVVFDAPAHPGGFEARIARARRAVEGLQYASILEQATCTGLEHLRAELARVEQLGGEGLMARKPGSSYEVGRSDTLYKVKTFHDAEARVVAHSAGTGRHEGRLGALVVELADGTRFNVGSGFSDAEREAPPSIGALITFRYQELSEAGVPRFPTYVGVRIDANQASTLGSAAKRAARSKAPSKSAVTNATAATTSTSAVAAAGVKRAFELVDGSSAKFWEIRVSGSSFSTRYGKIGSDGQQTHKDFATADKARAEADKLIAEKTKKGYVEKT